MPVVIRIGLVLQYLVGYRARLVPPNAGYCDFINPEETAGPVADISSGSYHLVLPWITFAVLFAAIYVRMIRANVMDTLE